jgi:hypothetical protein
MITLTPENMAECFTPPEEVRRLFLLYSTKVERAAAVRAAKRIDSSCRGVDIALLDPVSEKLEEYPFD